MSEALVDRDRIDGRGGRARAARVGAAVAILAMALTVYGAYGDSQASDSQKSAVPFTVVAIVVAAIVTFGALVPPALGAVEGGTAAARRWAIGFTTAAVVGLVIFWSGLPLVAGGAAALVGRAGKDASHRSRAFSAAWVLGLFAAGISILVTVVGNLLH